MKYYEELHAMQYAENTTKLYQYEKYKQKFPALFSHAVIVTRPADSNRDYYVPPVLKNCIVVDYLAWNYYGCRYVSCFPFKTYEEPCRPEVDAMQWTRVDNKIYVRACQPACDRGLSLETRYRDGDCFVTNQAKKLFVMYPERYNGMVAKQARLRLEGDRLSIDEIYCQAYGMQFDEETSECYVPGIQYFTEILWGTTVFRRGFLEPLQGEYEPPPPPSEERLQRSEFERVWAGVPRTSTTVDLEKTVSDPTSALNLDFEVHGRLRPESVAKIVKEVTAEVGVDLGIQAATSYAKYRLTQKISARMANRILVEKGVKHAFVHGIAKAATSGIVGKTAAMIGVRAGLSAATVAFAVYGAISLLIDVFDPYEYGKVMDRDRVEKIDRLLDLRYFETDDFANVRLTPEDVWNVLQDEEDVEEELSYYGERFEEYLEALKTVQWEHNRYTKKKINILPVTQKTLIRSPSRWVVLGLIVVGSLFLIKYVEYVAVLLCIILAFGYLE